MGARSVLRHRRGASLDYITPCHSHRSNSRKRVWEPVGQGNPPVGFLGGEGGVRCGLAHLPQERALAGQARVCRGARHRGVRVVPAVGKSCVLVSSVPREGVRWAGKGGWQGGGLWTNSAPCPLCPAPGGSVQDRALCCRLPPRRAGWGLQGQGTQGKSEAELVETCHVHGAAASPGLASHPLDPSPLVCIFINIYIEIYMMQSAIETRPRIGRANCVSISPETVTYLVLLGVVVVQDRVLGCLHFF